MAVHTDDSSEGEPGRQGTAGRQDVETGLRDRDNCRPPQAMVPSSSRDLEQRDDCTSSRPLEYVTDSRVDSQLGSRIAMHTHCSADDTTSDRRRHAVDVQTQHTVDPSTRTADHNRPSQLDYVSIYSEESEHTSWEGFGQA